MTLSRQFVLFCCLWILRVGSDVSPRPPLQHAGVRNEGRNLIDECGFVQSRLNSGDHRRFGNILRLKGGSSPYDAAEADGPSVFQVVEVPADRIGVLIGRAGSTIKELGRLAGCKIWVDPQTNVPGYPIRYVNVQGTLSRVEAAKRMIRERIENIGAPASDGTIRDTVQVPDHVVGVIIGKGGSGIKSITAMSGAKIFIPGESPPGSTERTLTISGYPAAVAHAKQLILNRVPNSQYPQQMELQQNADASEFPQATSGGASNHPYGYDVPYNPYPPVGAGNQKQYDITENWRDLYASVEQQQRDQQLSQPQQHYPTHDHAQHHPSRYHPSSQSQPRY